MSDEANIFYVYERLDYPSIYAYAFKNKQPDYMSIDCKKHKCISLTGDIDSYIHSLQHNHDVKLKELKSQLKELESCVRDLNNGLEFYINKELYDSDCIFPTPEIVDDGGKKARETIAKHKDLIESINKEK